MVVALTLIHICQAEMGSIDILVFRFLISLESTVGTSISISLAYCIPSQL
jgi:hypothetical protein